MPNSNDNQVDRCTRYYAPFFSTMTAEDRAKALNQFRTQFDKMRATQARYAAYAKANPPSPLRYNLQPMLQTVQQDGIVALRMTEQERARMMALTEERVDQLIQKRNRKAPETRGVKVVSAELGRFDEPTETYEFFDALLRTHGIYDVCHAYRGLPYQLKFVTLQINEDTDRGIIACSSFDDGTCSDTYYMHVDSTICGMKAIVYRTTHTDAETGAFRYIPGSHRMYDEEEKAIRKANDKSGLDVVHLPENRKLFAALPKKYQKKANFGNDLLGPSPEKQRLLDAERVYGADQGDMLLFDNDGIHRGSLFARPSQRQIFQLFLEPMV